MGGDWEERREGGSFFSFLGGGWEVLESDMAEGSFLFLEEGEGEEVEVEDVEEKEEEEYLEATLGTDAPPFLGAYFFFARAFSFSLSSPLSSEESASRILAAVFFLVKKSL